MRIGEDYQPALAERNNLLPLPAPEQRIAADIMMPAPQAQGMPPPQAQGMPPPQAQGMPAPQAQGMPPPQAQGMPPPQPQGMPPPHAHGMPPPMGNFFAPIVVAGQPAPFMPGATNGGTTNSK